MQIFSINCTLSGESDLNVDRNDEADRCVFFFFGTEGFTGRTFSGLGGTLRFDDSSCLNFMCIQKKSELRVGK
jgi:hypothetical protein